jgi:hypothetical protein
MKMLWLFEYLLKKALIILLCFLTYSISVGNIIIGSLFLSECGLSYGIPVWLLAFGCFGFLLTTYFLISWFLTRGLKKLKTAFFYQRLIFSLYIIFWLICGSTLIFINWSKFSDRFTSPNYCNPLLYYYSFSVLIFCWIIWAFNFLSFFFV